MFGLVPLSRLAGRGPKIPLPMRTMVAPSAMAAAMSSDIPMDSVSKDCKSGELILRWRNNAAVCLNGSRCALSPALGWGMTMSPRRRKLGSLTMDLARSGIASGVMPDLVASRSIFTWMQTLSFVALPCRWRFSRSATFSRSMP